MTIYHKIKTISIVLFLAIMTVIAGCASNAEHDEMSKSLPMDITNQIKPREFSVITHSTRSTIKDKNELSMAVEKASLKQIQGVEGKALVIHGQLKHSNPKYYTDTPFRTALKINDIEKVASNRFLIKSLDLEKVEIDSLHSPIESRIQKETERMMKQYKDGIIKGTTIRTHPSFIDRIVSWSN